jgi:hypothetical protein
MNGLIRGWKIAAIKNQDNLKQLARLLHPERDMIARLSAARMLPSIDNASGGANIRRRKRELSGSDGC